MSSSNERDCPYASGARRLFTFSYYSRIRGEPESFNPDDLSLGDLPEWVKLQVGQQATVETVDDCLFLSIATVRFNHIRERTGEIIDYLSNGLPGKGMGVTTRAAKGFMSKRIITRSFTNLSINAPQLFLPRNWGASEGVILFLGDVHLKSWFD